MKLRYATGMGSIVVLVWAVACVPPALDGQGTTGDAARGATLYTSDTCSSCHGREGCGSTGPNIQDTTFEKIDTFVRAATSPHLGETRPDLSDADLAALVAYLNGQSAGACAEIQLAVVELPAKYADFSRIATHNPQSDSYDADCQSCHTDRLEESALDGTRLAAHSIMQSFVGSGNQRCLNCHADGGDLIAQGSTRLRAEMFSGVATCASARCHGAGGPLPFYMSDK